MSASGFGRGRSTSEFTSSSNNQEGYQSSNVPRRQPFNFDNQRQSQNPDVSNAQIGENDERDLYVQRQYDLNVPRTEQLGPASNIVNERNLPQSNVESNSRHPPPSQEFGRYPPAPSMQRQTPSERPMSRGIAEHLQMNGEEQLGRGGPTFPPNYPPLERSQFQRQMTADSGRNPTFARGGLNIPPPRPSHPPFQSSFPYPAVQSTGPYPPLHSSDHYPPFQSSFPYPAVQSTGPYPPLPSSYQYPPFQSSGQYPSQRNNPNERPLGMQTNNERDRRPLPQHRGDPESRGERPLGFITREERYARDPSYSAFRIPPPFSNPPEYHQQQYIPSRSYDPQRSRPIDNRPNPSQVDYRAETRQNFAYGNARQQQPFASDNNRRNGQQNAGRYDDRRTLENNGYSARYNEYMDNDNLVKGPPRAPKDYAPKQRELEAIFNEDSADVHQHGSSIFTEDADIKVEGVTNPPFCENWEDMHLDEQLKTNILRSEYLRPRKIQQFVIPCIQDGFSVKCQSETGTGKTAAFLIPIVDALIKDKENGQLHREAPVCLIVAPSRELVDQLYEQAIKFCNATGITVARAYGQYSVSRNLHDIRNGCNILCACLGRLMDFVRKGHIHLRAVKYLVIDEADRLIADSDNTSFFDLLSWPELPSKDARQTLLFSATLTCPSPTLQHVCDEHIDAQKQVTITAETEANKRIRFIVYAVPSRPAKFRYLIKYLQEIKAENDGECPKTLIFLNRKVDVDRVAIDITSKGIPATTIHGGRSQDLREEALKNFRYGDARVLVATDVCARGVDIKEMDYVINYDLPNGNGRSSDAKSTFLQRTGRTGRTHIGTAVSFFLESEDRDMASTIDEIINSSGQESPAFLKNGVNDSDFKYEDTYVQAPSHALDDRSRNAGYSQNGSPQMGQQQ